ncbi:MAG TPA: carbohydrate porin [Phycisphaerae bacterium]|nr:carbohydrate porin [Phycisphaerae bacterium]
MDANPGSGPAWGLFITFGCWAVLALPLAVLAQEGRPADEPAAEALEFQSTETAVAEERPPVAEQPTVEDEEAGVEEPPQRRGFFEDIWTRDRLTGDWGGRRTELEDLGFKFNLYINTFYGVNAHGGQDTTNAQRLSGTWDLHIFLDLEKMGLIPGGELFVWPKGHFSRNVNRKVGALGEPFDDADGDKVVYIDVLQYQQTLLDKKLRFRFGYLDQQMAFDRNAYANSEDKQFSNTYLDNNNAIVPLPIGLGAVAFIDPTEWLGFAIGASDGDARIFRTGLDTTFHDSADFFGYFQTEFRPKIPSKRGDLPGNYRFGLIYDPGDKQEIISSLGGLRRPHFDSGDVGWYVSFDQLVYREQPEDDQGLGLFFRYGHRQGDVNRMSNFWSAGVQYQGLIPERGKDVLGFGLYSVHSSQQYRREINEALLRETGYELYYSIYVTPWLQITPDLQYIARPGALSSTDDAFVMGLRARLTF